MPDYILCLDPSASFYKVSCKLSPIVPLFDKNIPGKIQMKKLSFINAYLSETNDNFAYGKE